MQQNHSSPRFFDDLTPRQRKRMQRNEQKGSHHVTERNVNVIPMNKKQQKLIEAIDTQTQVFILGPAGTGKTYICASMAAKYFMQGKIDKIYITRPNVASGNEIGFLPGTQDEKMQPWVAPLTEVLKEKMGNEAYEIALKRKTIEIVPLETMRGRSFDNAFVILDESENCTFRELKMFVTRIGKNSKVIINGDIEQTDLQEDSGYKKILEIASNHKIGETSIVEFGIEDCVRSGLVKEWLIAFHKEKL